MRIVFFGSGEFGVPTLARLAESHRVTGVVSQPDRPAGRGGRMTPTPVAEWTMRHLPGVPLLRPERVNVAEVVAAVHGLEAEAWVVIAFGQKLGRALLGDRFAVNLHASLLPRWRGAAPINAAILAGDAVTGNSVITLADAMDAGLVLGQSERAVPPDATAGWMHDRLAADGPALVERVLAQHAEGSLRPREQDPALVTLAPKLSRADGWVDFGQGAEACRRRINGLSPWPGVTVGFRGERVKLLRAECGGEGGSGQAGSIASAAEGLVRCGGGTLLRLLEVQPAGKRGMSWRDFANGARVNAEEVLTGGETC
jgi:methionyl-tRNA formyltransferase